MSPIVVVIVCIVAATGLVAAVRMRRAPRDREVLAALGFRPGPTPGALVGIWRGRTLTAATGDGAIALELALVPSPLAYDRLTRALGRGDLLALLYALHARTGAAELAVRLAANLPAKSLRRELDRVAALADALERLPKPEGMARWFMELTQGDDREAALARLVAAFPDAPETLTACRAECEQPRDQRAAALARRHLESGRAG